MFAFFVHAAATWFLTGLIWLVQIVHYPLFSCVGAENYAAYQAEHVRRITWVAGPAMLVEAATAAALVAGADGLTRREALLNALLLAAIWVATALLQVPAHEKLALGFDASAHGRLVATNWLRTALWSARAAGLVFVATRWGASVVRPI